MRVRTTSSFYRFPATDFDWWICKIRLGSTYIAVAVSSKMCIASSVCNSTRELAFHYNASLVIWKVSARVKGFRIIMQKSY